MSTTPISPVSYIVGDLARLSVLFTSVSTGSPIDPSTVTLTIKDPSGTISIKVYGTDAIIKDSTGAYHFDQVLSTPVSVPSEWAYSWDGGGSAIAIGEQILVVNPSVITETLPVQTPEWTQADLLAIDKAIATGARQVHFQDRSVTYASADDLMKARTLIWQYLHKGQTQRRQYRFFTRKGW